MTSTQSHLDEMHKRVAAGTVPAAASDPDLTEARQRQIVEGASKVLFANGFCKTSIRDIASACGMSMGQLYHYISSKDDILYLMHLYSQEMWHQHLDDAGFEHITDPVDKFEHALHTTMRHLAENRELYRFIFTESKYMDKVHLRQVLELDDQNVVGFYKHLLSLIPGREIKGREVELAANLVSYICMFMALRGWNLDLKTTAARDAAAEFLVDFIFRGLGIERGAKNKEE
jgi:AcrR family transcriptional regulator